MIAVCHRWRVVSTVALLMVTVAALHFSEIPADGSPAGSSGAASTEVLFIGDSYTAGPTTPGSSYGCMSASALGWRCDVSAQPGTGYINGGPGHRLHIAGYDEPSTALVERLSGLRDAYPANVVVLDGGRNDMEFDMAEVMQTFAYTLTQVLASWPDSRIVVIAPWFVNEPVLRPQALGGRTVGEEFGSVIGSSPEFGRVSLIDPAALGWFAAGDPKPYLADDGIHPNPAGVKKIAGLLTAALVREGVASPS